MIKPPILQVMAQENCIAAVVLQFRATTLTVSVMFKNPATLKTS